MPEPQANPAPTPVLPSPPASHGWLQFAFVIILLITLAYSLNWSLVAHPVFFIALVVCLILIAFLSSATEAAFSVANKRTEIQDALFNDRLKLAGELQTLDKKIADKGSENLTNAEEKQRSRLLRQLKALGRKDKALNTDQDQFIGALSAFSVFLNTALVAFLPISLAKASASDVIKIPYYLPVKLDKGYDLSRFEFVISEEKLLIFFASSLLVLIVGKIVPKLLGLRRPKQFAYSLYPFARGVQLVLGWITVGINWPLNIMIPKKEEK